MDGVTFVRSLDPNHAMPMAAPWAFRIESVEEGEVRVVQGGFAATVLDIALGLVTDDGFSRSLLYAGARFKA